VFPVTVSAWTTRSIRTPVFDRVASVPNGSAPVTQKAQGLGRMPPYRELCPPLAVSTAPENRRCPTVSTCGVINVVALMGAARSVGQEVQHAGWQNYAINDRFDGYHSPRSIFQTLRWLTAEAYPLKPVPYHGLPNSRVGQRLIRLFGSKPTPSGASLSQPTRYSLIRRPSPPERGPGPAARNNRPAPTCGPPP
jgi:hypothetical protein